MFTLRALGAVGLLSLALGGAGCASDDFTVSSSARADVRGAQGISAEGLGLFPSLNVQ